MRDIAYHRLIAELLKGTFTQGEGWDSNSVSTSTGPVSRVNVIGIVVAKQEKSCIIDDGSGEMLLRSIDASLNEIAIGQVVLVVGRIREQAGERYIMPEIVKPTDAAWMALRKRGAPQAAIQPTVEEEVSPVVSLLNAIRTLDKGSGASIDELLQQRPQAESMIKDLLLKGEIFEVKPGQVKVLE